MNDISIHFEGPFTFYKGKNSIFHCPYSKEEGIYLWTFRQTGGSHLIHYVGETRNFSERHREHLIHILSMNYGIFDPDDAKNGICTLLWKGLWRDKSPEGPNKLIEEYPNQTSAVLRYINELTVFFAPIKVDKELRKHIEGSIGWNLRLNHKGCKKLYLDDNKIGIKPTMRNIRLRISSSEKISGLNPEIDI